MPDVPMTESSRVITFIERLKHPAGTEWFGQRIKLLEWQKEYLRKLLDTKSDDGSARYEQSLLFLPKKQGKTTFVAAIALALLFLRKHQQVAAVSISKDQAAITHKFCRSMIEQESSLNARCKVYKGHVKKIECPYSDSSLRVYSSDATGANGFDCSILIYDEVCFEKSSELWDAIVSGGINRIHILAIGLSTAGESASGFGYRLYDKAKSIQKNPELDPSFLPVIYEAPRGPNGEPPDWTDPNVYLACSPTFKEIGAAAIARIKRMIESAKNHPEEIRKLLRYHLNQWSSVDNTDPWIDVDAWNACPNTLKPEILLGRECFCGIDLASNRDMTAKALLFNLSDIEVGLWAVLLKFYMPSVGLDQKEKRDAGAMYTTWSKLGILTATPGDVTDYNYIREDCKKDRELYRVRGIAIDRGHGSGYISMQLIEDGHDVIPVGQGALTVAPAAREFSDAVFSKKLVHFDNPVLRWNISNCIARLLDDAGNVKPSKMKSSGRIDGVYAIIDAFALAQFQRIPANNVGTPRIFVF
ncbi:MAG: terminase large subunit [Phycisphaerales bacterium]|nr:terminase large subunit [Phycisphaerales bacterium]